MKGSPTRIPIPTVELMSVFCSCTRLSVIEATPRQPLPQLATRRHGNRLSDSARRVALRKDRLVFATMPNKELPNTYGNCPARSEVTVEVRGRHRRPGGSGSGSCQSLGAEDTFGMRGVRQDRMMGYITWDNHIRFTEPLSCHV
ncbi:hypothetical protein J6590_039721 [Homalodisca vitripennis]|nr:hypothetical protein J6590_039721 [Homalodisca vitripennis]